jgi:hypothetical protein
MARRYPVVRERVLITLKPLKDYDCSKSYKQNMHASSLYHYEEEPSHNTWPAGRFTSIKYVARGFHVFPASLGTDVIEAISVPCSFPYNGNNV